MKTNAVYKNGVLFSTTNIITGQLISFPGEQVGRPDVPIYIGVARREIEAGSEVDFNPNKNTNDVIIKTGA